jgi:hypothetical protein
MLKSEIVALTHLAGDSDNLSEIGSAVRNVGKRPTSEFVQLFVFEDQPHRKRLYQVRLDYDIRQDSHYQAFGAAWSVTEKQYGRAARGRLD